MRRYFTLNRTHCQSRVVRKWSEKESLEAGRTYGLGRWSSRTMTLIPFTCFNAASLDRKKSDLRTIAVASWILLLTAWPGMTTLPRPMRQPQKKSRFKGRHLDPAEKLLSTGDREFYVGRKFRSLMAVTLLWCRWKKYVALRIFFHPLERCDPVHLRIRDFALSFLYQPGNGS